MTPTLGSWGILAGRFAVETALVAILAAVACRFIRDGRRQRACWQSAVLALALLSVSEMAGSHARTAFWLGSRTSEGRLVVTLGPPEVIETLSPRPPVRPEGRIGERNRPTNAATWPGWLWIGGAMAVLLVGGATRAWVLLERRRMPGASPEVWSVAEPLLASLGLRRVNFRVWKRVQGPVAFGLWRPTVVIPPDFARRFRPAQQKVMLAHELAHLAGHDPFWFALTDLLCALGWWHPAIWWARRHLRRTCEAAADEASALVPDGPATLAESLVALGLGLSSSGLAAGLGVVGSGFRSELGRRVQRLLGESARWDELPGRWRWAPRAVAVLLAGFVGAAPLQAVSLGSMFAALGDSPAASAAETPLVSQHSSAGKTFSPPGAPEHHAVSLAQTGTVALAVSFAVVPQNGGLEAMFRAAPEASAGETGPDTNLFPGLKLPSQRNVIADRSTNSGGCGILTAPAFRVLQRRLRNLPGVKWLSAAPLNVPAGREARAQVTDGRTVVFDVQTTDGTPTTKPSVNYLTGKVPVGPSASVSAEPATEQGWRQ